MLLKTHTPALLLLTLALLLLLRQDDSKPSTPRASGRPCSW